MASTVIFAPLSSRFTREGRTSPTTSQLHLGSEAVGHQKFLFFTTLIQAKLLICTWYSRQALFALLHSSLEVRELQGFTNKHVRITDSHSISARTGHPSGWGKVGTETALFRAKCQIPVTKQPYKGTKYFPLSILRGWRRHLHECGVCQKGLVGLSRHRNDHSTKVEKMLQQHFIPSRAARH